MKQAFPCGFEAKNDRGTTRNRIFGFGHVKKGKRAKKMKGGGGGRTLPHPPPPTLSLAPYLAQSLTLVPHSLLRNRTEMLAMQAIHLHTYQHGFFHVWGP